MIGFHINYDRLSAGSAFVVLNSESSNPVFSVVVATYGRDSKIIPTLLSVANQSFRDFEVLVVSDGPFSKTLKDIVSSFGKSFYLYSIPTRTRSQSGPNNFGLEVARGKYIAYLGHDDVWSTEHLSCLADAYKSYGYSDFAVSGCIYFGPAGTEDQFTWITGIFENSDLEAAGKYFFPPSSFSHKRSLFNEILQWPEPLSTRRPVDQEFLIGAFERGCSFVSTKKISVFKFASAQRYLSYLCPDDYEQHQILKLMRKKSRFKNYLEKRVKASVRNGLFMAPSHAPIDMFTPGQRVHENEIVRGIRLPQVLNLVDFQKIDVGDDYRGYDWYPLETVDEKGFRWTGPNHHPRMLLAFCCEGLVSFIIRVKAFASRDIEKSLKIVLNGNEEKFKIVKTDTQFIISFTANLKLNAVSVLEFQMSHAERPAFSRRRSILYLLFPRLKSQVSLDPRKLGLCLEGVELQPQGITHL